MWANGDSIAHITTLQVPSLPACRVVETYQVNGTFRRRRKDEDKLDKMLLNREKVVYLLTLILILIDIATAVDNSLRSNKHQRRERKLVEQQLAIDKPTNSLVIEDEFKDCGFDLERLPSRVIPLHYNLVLQPDIESRSFDGAVQINLHIATERECSNATVCGLTYQRNGTQQTLGNDYIILHAANSLSIDNIWYLDKSENRKRQDYLEVRELCRVNKRDLLVVKLEKELEANSTGQLHLTFSGLFGSKLEGLYASSNGNNNSTFMAVTQFQPDTARRAFPCFDEPAFKATFELTLIHESNLTSLSNTRPIKEQMIEGNRFKFVKFAKTPKMSTYLLAFVVGELEFIEEILDNGRVRVRVYAPPGKAKMGHLALRAATRGLVQLEEQLASEFAIDKLDLVSVSDFSQGAMENWGLLTFKESQLLLDEQASSSDSRATIIGTVLHELAHQWFGNLVTLSWWDDLWMNEGFATWFEYETSRVLFPDFNYASRYLVWSHSNALNEDLNENKTRAIRQSREGDNLTDLFDAFAYNKGAAVVRLLHDDLLGKKQFDLAIRDYLRRFRFKNANWLDLCRSLEISAQQPVCGFLHAWLEQPGHPLLRVSLNNTNNELRISQERFLVRNSVDELANGSISTVNNRTTHQIWPVPITLLISNGRSRDELMKVWLREPETRVTLPDWFSASWPKHWFKLNANFTGFYRVKYTSNLFELMKGSVISKQMVAHDRLNLISDSCALVAAQEESTQHLLELLTWFERETSGQVWLVMHQAYLTLSQVYRHTPLRGKLEQFGRQLFGSAMQIAGGFKMSSQANDDIDKQAREAALSLLVELDHQPAIREALDLFEWDTRELAQNRKHVLAEQSSSSEQYLSTNIEPSLRSAAYTAVARRGSDAQLERLFVLFNASRSLEERSRIAHSLAKAESEERLELTWNWLKQLANWSLESRTSVLLVMPASGEPGRRLIKRLLEEELATLMQLDKEPQVGELLEELAYQFGTKRLNELNNLFEKHKNSTEWQSVRERVSKQLERDSAIAHRDAHEFERLLNEHLKS